MLKTWVWDVRVREGSQWMLRLGQECLQGSWLPVLCYLFIRIPYVLLHPASHNQTFYLQSFPISWPPSSPSTSLCDKLGRFVEGQNLLPALK